MRRAGAGAARPRGGRRRGDGERRWRASQISGLDTIPAIIKRVGDEAAIAMALIENIQRENISNIHQCSVFKILLNSLYRY